uniref:Integrase, catalytic region, zinc finger, CCHC-type, peptidase aspartic, catalytic n=1 Tax=Tanacetum cinerariifolium TaxID=118510 RepID=A0A6L2M904_TANCI|nr:integrase, catalytic region, zinc finger, CCHC-type, peptidase aspartic, catalytic [Tanacetum cinerariifolium]
MSNTNTNLQTQTSNALHNAIMEAGGKDHPPMLAAGNYVQWKSKIKRYIDTKPNSKLIHYCHANPPYIFTWVEQTSPVSEGSSDTHTEGLKQDESINVQDLETNLHWKFGKFTSRDGESLELYYSRSQQATTRNKGRAIVNSPQPTHDKEPATVAEDDEISKEKEIDKLMALISLSFKKIYKSTNNNLRTSLNTSRANQDNTPRINRGTGYDNQRAFNITRVRETVGTKVTPDATDNFGSIFDVEPLQKVQHDDDNYNVFVNKREHSEQPESVNDIYPDEHNIIIDSLDMSHDREQDNQDDNDDLAKEHDLLASLIEKLKCEIDDSTIKFGNDQIVPILGYGYLVQGNITIKRVYYVGLNHNLFSVGHICDADLEVAFWKSTC